jgi:hypothetical protein
MNMKLTLVSLKLIINLVALCKYIINLENIKNTGKEDLTQ